MNIIKKITAAAIAVLSAVPLTAPTFNAYSEALPNQNGYEDIDRNWAKLLQYTLHFYDANMCGTDVSDKNRFSWRGNCHTYDAKVPLQPMDEEENGTNLDAAFIEKYKDILDPDGDGFVDVSGGFHDAGDFPKHMQLLSFHGDITNSVMPMRKQVRLNIPKLSAAISATTSCAQHSVTKTEK